MNKFMRMIFGLHQWSQPFLHGGTLLSYLNFRDTPTILVNNKKIFTENLSMISQLSFQNHGDLKKEKKESSLKFRIDFSILIQKSW